MKTSLWLVLRLEGRVPRPPRAPKPGVSTEFLVSAGVNPNRQRKGKSGELPRRGPR